MEWCLFSATIVKHEPSLPVEGVFLRLLLGVDVLSEGLRFSLCSPRLIYCLVPQEQERTVLVWGLLWNWTLMDSGLFLSNQQTWTFFVGNPRKGSTAHVDETFSPISTNQVDLALGGCCRSHGPYRGGPSSVTSLKRGFSPALTLGRVQTMATIARYQSLLTWCLF